MAEPFAKDIADARRDYALIPAGLLVAGTFIVKREWTLYAALVALLFGAYNFYSLRMFSVPYSDTQFFN